MYVRAEGGAELLGVYICSHLSYTGPSGHGRGEDSLRLRLLSVHSLRCPLVLDFAPHARPNEQPRLARLLELGTPSI